MASVARITAIDYDPPGRDIRGEYILIRNVGSSDLDLRGASVRDAAPARPHSYTFKQSLSSVPLGGFVRLWTKTGIDTVTDVYWNLAAPVWNNRGDTAVLRDATGAEISRYESVPLPPGTDILRTAVPAFWQVTPDYDAYWSGLDRAGPVANVVVVPESWTEFAAIDSDPQETFRGLATARIDRLKTTNGTVLGYVSTRISPAGPLRPTADVIDGWNDLSKCNPPCVVRRSRMYGVQPWFDLFPNIDGLYFDELVLPETSIVLGDGSLDLTAELERVTQFRGWTVRIDPTTGADHRNAKLMILAGQCLDERVIGPDVDWTLLWEDTHAKYRTAFAARVGTNNKPVPPWWKNPAYRRKIAHVVHTASEPESRDAVSLTNERNAGHIFVMNQRGRNREYNNLPSYWDAEVAGLSSYYDLGFDPLRALRAAHRYAVAKGKLHGWPNFEGAWPPSGHMRGMFLLEPGGHASVLDVLPSLMKDPISQQPPALFDIPSLWAAADAYAQQNGYATAIPTFEEKRTTSGTAMRLIVFNTLLPWLQPKNIPIASTYQKPTFSEPGWVIRNVNRVALQQGFKASFPAFNGDRCYVFDQSAPVVWEDVPTAVYVQQL